MQVVSHPNNRQPDRFVTLARLLSDSGGEQSAAHTPCNCCIIPGGGIRSEEKREVFPDPKQLRALIPLGGGITKVTTLSKIEVYSCIVVLHVTLPQ